MDFRTMPMPEGWQQSQTAEGAVFYINSNTQATSWTDPRLQMYYGADLPQGWEVATDEQGRIYYTNHMTQKTQREHPTRPANAPLPQAAAPAASYTTVAAPPRTPQPPMGLPGATPYGQPQQQQAPPPPQRQEASQFAELYSEMYAIDSAALSQRLQGTLHESEAKHAQLDAVLKQYSAASEEYRTKYAYLYESEACPHPACGPVMRIKTTGSRVLIHHADK